MLTPYEKLFIRTFHYNGNIITERGTGEQNLLFQLAMDTVLTDVSTVSVQLPHHTQTSSNSPTIEADGTNGYVHKSLFDRTYCIFRRN